MSRAGEIFEAIQTGQNAKIEELARENVTEELFLDYKGVSTPTGQRSLSDDDRRNASKAISGFANSEGGVVIWGVDCRADKSGKENVQLKLIADPAWFKSILDSAVGGLTSPPHQTVQSIAINMPIGGGVVVTLIPEGLNVPYRSNDSKSPGYFMRAGSSFLPVPHAVLAAMFGRTPAPRICGRFRPLKPQAQPGEQLVRVSFEVVLENIGRGIAEDLFAILTSGDQNSVRLRMKSVGDLWISDSTESQRVLITKRDFVRLIPSAQAVPCQLQLEFSQHSGPFSFEATCGSSTSPGDIFKCSLSAEALSEIHGNLSHSYGSQGGLLKLALERVEAILSSSLSNDHV